MAPIVCNRVKVFGYNELALRKAEGRGPESRDRAVRWPLALGPLQETQRSSNTAPGSRWS